MGGSMTPLGMDLTRKTWGGPQRQKCQYQRQPPSSVLMAPTAPAIWMMNGGNYDASVTTVGCTLGGPRHVRHRSGTPRQHDPLSTPIRDDPNDTGTVTDS